MAESETPAPVANGRDTRFKPSNQAGKGHGNPWAAKVNELRKAMLDCVDGEQIKQLFGVLLCRAKEGDVAAAREVLDRIFGKAKQETEISGGAGGEPFYIVFGPRPPESADGG